MGRNIKKDKEGIIINKVELDKSIIFLLSFVSQYNQIKAKKLVIGIETINPAKKDERFAISATKTTMIAVTKILITKYIIFLIIIFNYRHLSNIL